MIGGKAHGSILLGLACLLHILFLVWNACHIPILGLTCTPYPFLGLACMPRTGKAGFRFFYYSYACPFVFCSGLPGGVREVAMIRSCCSFASDLWD